MIRNLVIETHDNNFAKELHLRKSDLIAALPGTEHEGGVSQRRPQIGGKVHPRQASVGPAHEVKLNSFETV